jgi:hypothetical protein
MREWLGRRVRELALRPKGELATFGAAWIVIIVMTSGVLAPTLGRLSTIGGHDWDQMESHRYLVMKTIRRFHQFPFWNPYACGGHSNWGGFESGTTLVSPWLPFYLTMTLPHAMRVEVWGSAFLSAIGAWVLAGRFAVSPAARALVVVAFAVNGRWALQIATGHTWHLAYAWTPWTLYFYDRAVGADPTRGLPRWRDVVLCAACIAAMAYTGGIYPLPHTVVAVALYGAFLAALEKSYRPVLVGVAVGVLAFGLAAPKVLPVLEAMARYPRIVESPESIDVTAFFQILTSRDQDIGAHPAKVDAPWGWHEFGMYVGWPVVVAVTFGIFMGRGSRESALKWVGLFFVVVGFGTFDAYAPWPLIHSLPIFKSQHVPSRWQYPALLLLLTVTAGVIDRVLRSAGSSRRWLEFALLAGVACVACDVGIVAWRPMTHAFWVTMPATAESTGPFRTELHLPEELAYMVNYAPLTLSAEMANIGTIDCATFPGLNNFVRDSRGRTDGLGARGRGDPQYKGEAYVADGVGQAIIEKWTPNEVTVAVHDAKEGEHVVLNQNWDGGWSANGSVAMNLGDQVAAELHASDATVVFRYRPRSWWLGLTLFASTAGGIGWAYRIRRRSLPFAAYGQPVNATLSIHRS